MSLVPYGSGSSLMRAASYAAATNPYARNALRAARVIQYAYRNRQKIKKAYMTTRKVVKYVRKKRTMSPKYTRHMEKTAKRPALARQDVLDSPAPVFVILGQLNSNIINFPGFTSTNAISAREGLNLYVTGIKFCRNFQFINTPFKMQPIVLHWAVVQPKQSAQGLVDFVNVARTRFFRYRQDAGDRDHPFNNNTTGSTWDQAKICLPMNPDHNFNIIFHRKKTLEQRFPDSSGFHWDYHKWQWKIEFYAKINKTFAYNTTGQTEPNHPLFEFFWYEANNPGDYPTGLDAIGSYVTTQRLHTVYFKDKR